MPIAATRLNAVATDSATTDVGLSTLRQNLEVRRAQLMTAMNGLTPTNPLYLQNQAEIADIDKQLNASLSTVESKIADRKRLQYQAEVNRTRSVEQQIEASSFRRPIWPPSPRRSSSRPRKSAKTSSGCRTAIPPSRRAFAILSWKAARRAPSISPRRPWCR